MFQRQTQLQEKKSSNLNYLPSKCVTIPNQTNLFLGLRRV